MDNKEELIQWKGLIDNIQPLKDYIQYRLEVLSTKIEKLARTPGLDNAFHMTDIMSRVTELKELNQELEHKARMYEEEILHNGQSK